MTPKLIHRLFENQVILTPENIAVEMGDKKITFSELNQHANRIAHYLIKKGIKQDQLVGIRMHRSVEMIVVLMGILKAGGAYLPLDPKYPQNHLRYIIEKANPKIIIIDKNQYSLPIAGEEVLEFSKLDTEAISEPITNVKTEITINDLAYCIFTSGSTGRPKGVLVEHHSIVNFIQSSIKDYNITPKDRILQFASLNFDTSCEEIFPPLVSGSTLVLRQDDMADSMQRFLQKCAELRITILDLPSAFWHELVIYLDESKELLSPSLRLIIIGGERVSPDLLNIWHRLDFKTIRLDNTYGLTECACVSTRCELTQEERKKYAGREVSIGKAIENTNLYILDEEFKPVADGNPGELFIGSEGVARGYLNLPELTRKRFLEDPFFSDGGRMYKTGDVVLRRSDGALEYLGRNDDQIKIRGFRIEPGEIESAILEMKKVKQAIVIKKSDQMRNDNLVAYLVIQAGQTISKNEIWDFLSKRLPAHMIPLLFIFMDALPLSQNNKIDKKSLPEPNWDDLNKTTSAPPSTETESMLMGIWENALGRTGFGIDDGFFDIGGNSILAARMATALERETQQPLPMAILVNTQTIRELAKLLADRGWKPSWQSVIPMQANGEKPPLFLVHAMWGDILSYRQLVNCIEDKDQPVFGIRACGFDGKTAPFTDLKKMAAFYIQEIKNVSPFGPYYLGGYSFGGTVAFEMAQQLISQGNQIDLLAMFDTTIVDSVPPEFRPSIFEKYFDEFSRGLIASKKWFRISSERKSEIWDEAKLTVKDWITSKLLGKRFISPGEIEGEERKAAMPESYRVVHEANTNALKSYTAKPYPGKVTLFNAEERQWSDLIYPMHFWKKMALGGVESISCSGKHYSILDQPHVRDLAEKLEIVLQNKQSGN